MRRKTFHIARDFFLVGGIVPVVLLIIWKLWFESRAGLAAQAVFVKVGLVLWPTAIQILYVPHAERGSGHAWTIAILIAQNAILYSLVALVVAWTVARLRHHEARHVQQPK